MSGFVGIVNIEGAPIDASVLEAMTASLAFRGPDDCGIRIDDAVGFGHRLLRAESQDDHQPYSLDGRVWIVADASLDARRDLQRALEGHGFEESADAGDARLIAHAYAVWGEDCVDHLLGDFAFGIWDGPRQTLFCARDHFGVKPFYYAASNNAVVFSNTLNCLRVHPAVSDRLNDRAIGDFLLFGYNRDRSTTAFGDIHRLAPGHVLSWRRRSLRVRRYWTLPIDSGRAVGRPTDYVEEFRTIWRKAVADRLRGDRVGVLMSGGLDSTAVAVTAAESHRERPHSGMHAYTLAYDGLMADRERHYAEIVADSLAIPIHVMAAHGYELLRRLDEAACRTPEPSDHPLPAVTADLFAEVASTCRVALTGEGGDAALAGPSASYFANLLRRGRVARWTTDVVRCVANGELPPLGVRSALKRAFPNGTDRFDYPPWVSAEFAARVDLQGRWLEVNQEAGPAHSWRPTAYRALCSPFWQSLFETYDPGFTSRPVVFRHPFFDARLLTFLLTVPPVPWFVNKKILREAMRGPMPEAVRRRPKTPIVADPVCALLKRPSARRLNASPVSPELLQYVDLSKVPRVAGLPDLVERYGSAWHVITRPLCLGHWLAHARSRPSTERIRFDGKNGPTEET